MVWFTYTNNRRSGIAISRGLYSHETSYFANAKFRVNKTVAKISEGVVLLRHETYLNVICEKLQFSICDFCNNFRDYERTYIYTVQNILNDVQTKGKGEINTA